MGLFRRESAGVPKGDDEAREEDLAEAEDEFDENTEADTDNVDAEGEDLEEADLEDEELDEDHGDDDEGAYEPSRPHQPILPRLAAVGNKVRSWPWWTPVLLILIFLGAIFIRSYFYWEPACPEYIDGVCLYSGNDPNYHKRAVDYVHANHQWLAWDPLQNYPAGAPNPNPPAYEFSVVLIGYLISPIIGDTDQALTWSMEQGGALWASFTIFPVFFVGREMFGRRPGLIAAFLLAVMAGNIERTPVGFSDHDGFFVFFLVCGFYYFIRAMKYTKNRTYVREWKQIDDVTNGFMRFVREHKIALLYTLMASTMWGAVALSWKGFPYIYAIILVYYFITVVAQRWFRPEDSFAVGMLTMIAFTWVIVISLPYYYSMKFINWYEIYFLVWAAAGVVTFFFIPTRNIPWIVIVIGIGLLLGVGLLLLNIFAPDVAATILSGAGYFERNKLYGTIAEAQPPDVSRLVASYGYVTSLLAVGGVGLMALRLPRRWSNAYVLMLAWAGAAIYMALTAVRFMYNATPLFAIIAGWILWGIIDKTGFSFKLYRERWARFTRWRKIRTVPFAHTAVAFFVVFMVIWPNVMQGLDAGIPFETKKSWDTAIYNFMPDFTDPFVIQVGDFVFQPLNDIHVFRPDLDTFDPERSNLWYLGAFGTSFMSDYWAVSMRWLATQDTEVPEGERPAFISWWDYGHWAMHVGRHPAAADNFQNGFQFAGNFIGAQGEENSTSLILARYLQTVPGNPSVDALALHFLGQEGYDAYKFYAQDPASHSELILSNPEKYGRRDPPISHENAFLILVSGIINERVTPDDQIWWLRDVEEQAGFSMRYFAVDVRMFPFNAGNTGIFYAPIILADFDRNDFVEIRCNLDSGQTIPCDDVTASQRVVGTEIAYKEAFYNSMFVRAYLGYTGNDVGGSYHGFPGIQSSCGGDTSNCVAGSPPMQGWNMSHWRMVQRTVYFNPNSTDLANHTSEWQIITDQEADQYIDDENVTIDRQILGLGEQTGTGVMFLKYYAGAWVNGTVRTPSGLPVPNARVTVFDDLRVGSGGIPGVPHGFTQTNEDGNYSILVPFGNVTLVASAGGNPDPIALMERVELGRIVVPVSDDQAMRKEIDVDGDGVADYNIQRDILAVPGALQGRVYLDKGTPGAFNPAEDQPLPGTVLTLNSTTANQSWTAKAEIDGTYRFSYLPGGVYNLTATDGAHNWTVADGLSVAGNATTFSEAGLVPGAIQGNVTGLLEPAANVTVQLEDLATGEVQTNITNGTGAYRFELLRPGNYTLSSLEPNATSFGEDVALRPGDQLSFNFTSIPTVAVDLQVFLDRNGNGTFDTGESAVNATIEVSSVEGDYFNLTTVGADGQLTTRFPPGEYQARAFYFDSGGERYAGLAAVTAEANGSTWSLALAPAVRLNGTVFQDVDGDGKWSPEGDTPEAPMGKAEVFLEEIATGAETRVIVRGDGGFDLVVPQGQYTLRVVQSQAGLDNALVAFLELNLTADNTGLEVALHNGTKLTGRVGYDADRDGTLDAVNLELIADAGLHFIKGPFRVPLNTTEAGDYTAWLEEGNWTLEVTAPGYVTNTTWALVNATELANNTRDVELNASLVHVEGRVGFDQDGDGEVNATEGFAGVTVAFEAEASDSAFGFGQNITVQTGADGNYSADISVGRYKVVISTDRGSGPDAHRYETWDEVAQSSAIGPRVVPQADTLVQNFSLRELTRLAGVAWRDLGSGVPDIPNRQAAAGATVTLRGGPAPLTATVGPDGAFEGYFPSGNYTAEGALFVPSVGTTQFFATVNLTQPVTLATALTALRPQADLHVYAFDDGNGDGVDNDNSTLIDGITVHFTNVTSSSALILNNNATVSLLPGRSYTYRIQDEKVETVGNVDMRVRYELEGTFTFTPGMTDLTLPVPRLYLVGGSFYWDRDGDGTFSPVGNEAPIGAVVEFREWGNDSNIVVQEAVEPVGLYEAYLPIGRYNITVDHGGFDTANDSWSLNLTDSPPASGWTVDIRLKAHDVSLTGFTYFDTNRNGELNRFEAGEAVASLTLFNATNLTDQRVLSVAGDGRYNVTLPPGTYTLFAVGDHAGTPVAGVARVEVDPVGGLAWQNVSLSASQTITGTSFLYNTTGERHTVPVINYTVALGTAEISLPQPAGSFVAALPEGTYRITATTETQEFGRSMNYTLDQGVLVDFEPVTQDLNFTKDRRYTVRFDYVPPANQMLELADSVNYTVTMTNNGTDNATFDLVMPPEAQPGGWTYMLEFDNVTLEIGESRTLWVVINTTNETRGGLNTAMLRATPRNVSGEGGSVDLELTSETVYRIKLSSSVESPSASAEQTDYRVVIENDGNAVDLVRLTVSGVPDGYTAQLDIGHAGREVEIEPFEETRVLIHVKRDPSAPFAPAGTRFTVSALSLTNASGSFGATVQVELAYADLHIGPSGNATKATGPDGSDLVTVGPLTTPGFELAASLAAVGAVAVLLGRRRGGRT